MRVQVCQEMLITHIATVGDSSNMVVLQVMNSISTDQKLVYKLRSVMAA
jgi:hypothetical protein